MGDNKKPLVKFNIKRKKNFKLNLKRESVRDESKSLIKTDKRKPTDGSKKLVAQGLQDTVVAVIDELLMYKYVGGGVWAKNESANQVYPDKLSDEQKGKSYFGPRA